MTLELALARVADSVDIWRVIVTLSLVANTVILGGIFYLLLRPMKKADEAARRLDAATSKVEEVGLQLYANRKLQSLIHKQATSTKHAVEQIPQQVEQKMQQIISEKAVSDALAASSSSEIIRQTGNTNGGSSIHKE